LNAPKKNLPPSDPPAGTKIPPLHFNFCDEQKRSHIGYDWIQRWLRRDRDGSTTAKEF
jgi:hypothetical protein